MTDDEILCYLANCDYVVEAHDGTKLFNQSYQIKNVIYDPENKVMKIITPDNEFEFKWVLGNGKIN